MSVPTKRKRSASTPSSGPAKATPAPAATEKKKSLLSDDGAFPRGGGSVLTPLELKQAANEAVQDVLFAVSIFAIEITSHSNLF